MPKNRDSSGALDPAHHVTERAIEITKDGADFMAYLKQCEQALQEVDDERAELNARKAEIIAGMINKGLNRDAVKAAIRYFKTPEEKREMFDFSYQVMRQALGVPVQDDWLVRQRQEELAAAGGNGKGRGRRAAAADQGGQAAAPATH